MRHVAGIFLVSLFLAAGVMSSASFIGVGTSEKAQSIHRSTPAEQLANQVVNRIHKSDRLDISIKQKKEPRPLHSEPILEGCDPAFSPLAELQVKFPGRCTT